MTQRTLENLSDKAFDCLTQNIKYKNVFKKKPNFELYLTIGLYSSSKDPSKKEDFGAHWIDNQRFAFNTTKFARFVGLKTNTINCALRQHQLKRERKLPLEEIKDFVNKKNWKVMVDTNGKYLRSTFDKSDKFNLLKWVNPMKKRCKYHEEMTENDDKIIELGEELSIIDSFDSDLFKIEDDIPNYDSFDSFENFDIFEE